MRHCSRCLKSETESPLMETRENVTTALCRRCHRELTGKAKDRVTPVGVMVMANRESPRKRPPALHTALIDASIYLKASEDEGGGRGRNYVI